MAAVEDVVMSVFSKKIIESTKLNKEEIKEQIRFYADNDECFENLVFEFGCEKLAEQFAND